MVKMFQEKMAGDGNDSDDLIIQAFKAYDIEGKMDVKMFEHALRRKRRRRRKRRHLNLKPPPPKRTRVSPRRRRRRRRRPPSKHAFPLFITKTTPTHFCDSAAFMHTNGRAFYAVLGVCRIKHWAVSLRGSSMHLSFSVSSMNIPEFWPVNLCSGSDVSYCR